MKKTLKYKGIEVNCLGIPVLSSVKNNILNKGEKGKRYFQHRNFVFNFPITSPKDLIVMYDIPSDKRKERDWFRRHLQKFDYTMIQESVWVGPSPLPKDFLDYVKSIGLLNKIRTLKLAKPYSVDVRNM